MNRNYFIHSKTLAAGFGIWALLVFATQVQAQTTNTKQIAKTALATEPAKSGTYQLIFNNRREDKDITLSQRELIAVEELRSETETVYARTTYSDDIRVKILPRNTINNKAFTPQPLKYYKEEHSYEEYSKIRYVGLQ